MISAYLDGWLGGYFAMLQKMIDMKDQLDQEAEKWKQ